MESSSFQRSEGEGSLRNTLSQDLKDEEMLVRQSNWGQCSKHNNQCMKKPSAGKRLKQKGRLAKTWDWRSRQFVQSLVDHVNDLDSYLMGNKEPFVGFLALRWHDQICIFKTSWPLCDRDWIGMAKILIYRKDQWWEAVAAVLMRADYGLKLHSSRRNGVV